MNPKLKKEWIEALRSGKIKQGRNALRSDDNYCCLGVLCEIAQSKGLGEWLPTAGGYSRYAYYFNHEMGYDSVPHTLSRTVNFSQHDGRILIQMNDTEEKSFNEIADWIEENIPGD